MLETAHRQWHPIASGEDLEYRHTFHGQLLGLEFGVWRADDSYVNVWENRCLHRGVRLSIGINDGTELKCQYHGWRYANRTAGCTYTPVHPADAPARTICNRTYPTVERYGLVWSGEAPEGEIPEFGELSGDDTLALRPIPVNAPCDLVFEHLQSHRFQPNESLDADPADVSHERTDGFAVVLKAQADADETRAVFVAQPVDSDRTVIRGILDATPAGDRLLDVLRHHNERLSELRDRSETQAADQPQPEKLQPLIQPISEELAGIPGRTVDGRTAEFRVQVARKWRVADGIAGFELSPIDGQLPTFQPGAHIGLHLPNGLVRQYSVTQRAGRDRLLCGWRQARTGFCRRVVEPA